MSEAAARPLVSVFDASAGDSSVLSSLPLPSVLTAPIRPDVVQFVHTNVNKNRRQAYCVKNDAGMDYAAESWGTGRAVSRIPRVPGGGTHRAGQGAFGNMCRGGRMFNPTRIWRKWHRHVNKNQRRYAISSALAASAVPSLVLARGHRIEQIPEMPLVIGGDKLAEIKKTKEAIELLEKFGADVDANKVPASRKVRAGKGKMRNRRYKKRLGPLLIHACDSPDLPRAFRNVMGVQLCHVDRLNLLTLAPGGHVGRFVIWTEDAFKRLDALYGTHTEKSTEKSGFSLPRPMISNADVARLINSEEIQKVIRDPRESRSLRARNKLNPLANKAELYKLNPYAEAQSRASEAAKKQKAGRQERVKANRNSKQDRRKFYQSLLSSEQQPEEEE